MALFAKENKTVAKPKSKEKTSEASSMKDLYQVEGVKTKTKLAKPNFRVASVLVRPLITEKATNLSASGKYVFVISSKANKISVAKSVEATYGVKPIAVNIINMEGKKVSRGQVKGKRSDWRKAIVTLKPGQTIKIYEGV